MRQVRNEWMKLFWIRVWCVCVCMRLLFGASHNFTTTDADDDDGKRAHNINLLFMMFWTRLNDRLWRNLEARVRRIRVCHFMRFAKKCRIRPSVSSHSDDDEIIIASYSHIADTISMNWYMYNVLYTQRMWMNSISFSLLNLEFACRMASIIASINLLCLCFWFSRAVSARNHSFH